jgi:hypothetical protein
MNEAMVSRNAKGFGMYGAVIWHGLTTVFAKLVQGEIIPIKFDKFEEIAAIAA